MRTTEKIDVLKCDECGKKKKFPQRSSNKLDYWYHHFDENGKTAAYADHPELDWITISYNVRQDFQLVKRHGLFCSYECCIAFIRANIKPQEMKMRRSRRLYKKYPQ